MLIAHTVSFSLKVNNVASTTGLAKARFRPLLERTKIVPLPKAGFRPGLVVF